MTRKPLNIFLSASRDMAEWSAAAAAYIRDFGLRHGLDDLNILDYRDIDPVAFDHSTTWQDVVGAPSQFDSALTIVLLGERLGTPVPSTFRLRHDIRARLRRDGYDWVRVADVDADHLRPDQVPLTGVLFEFFDAFLPRLDGSKPGSLRVIFKGVQDGEEPSFGNGEFRAQIEASSEPAGRKRQMRREYEQQLDWMNLFWRKLYGLQQHAAVFCADKSALENSLERMLTAHFLASEGRQLPTTRVNPHLIHLPGPTPYDLTHAWLFFGRSPQLAELVRRALQQESPRRIVPVIGESGAGKSSLLRAGLMNDACSSARRRLGWRSAFLSLPERPIAERPLEFLATALAQSGALPELGPVEALCQRLEGVSPHEAAHRLLEILASVHLTLSPGQGAPRLLLVVDQLELALDATCLNQTDSSAEWTSFLLVLAALGGSLNDPRSSLALEDPAVRAAAKLPCTVVLGLPADHLSAFESVMRPGEHVFHLPRLVDETAIREVITNTFLSLGLTIEPQAREALCRDAVKVAAASTASILPLLAVTLTNLHDRWKSNEMLLSKWKEHANPGDPFPKWLSWAGLSPPGVKVFDIEINDVNEQGGIGEAIGRLGELAWLEAEKQDALSAVPVHRLPVTRSRVRLQAGEITQRDFALALLLRSLVDVQGDPAVPDRLTPLHEHLLEDVARPMAESLQHHRLLTRRDDGTLWLVHQVVLEKWPRAAEWRKEEAQIYRTIARMKMDRQRWLEDKGSSLPDADRWLWTRDRDIELALNWIWTRGLAEDPDLCKFFKESTLMAIRENNARAGRLLRNAAYFGDIEWATAILAEAGAYAGEAVNSLSPDGANSPLSQACRGGCVDLARLLLSRGADPNQMVSNGVAPLLIASELDHSSIVSRLLEAGAVVDGVNDWGSTPLTQASELGRLSIVTTLLRAGADVNHRLKNGSTALILAAGNGHDAVVSALIAAGVDVNLATIHLDAAPSDEKSTLKTQGSVGVEISSGSQEPFGWTALLLSALNGHESVVARLLAGGADLKSENSEGWSAIALASRNGHDTVVAHLILAGADVNTIVTASNFTPLILAAEVGHAAVVDRLLRYGARTDYRSDRGQTALILAAGNGHLAVVERLLSAGAGADDANVDGETPLIVAAAGGYKDTVDRLLTAGALIDHADNSGQTALRLASEGGHLSVIKTLGTRGADIDLPDSKGVTPLMAAVLDYNETTVRFLLSHNADFYRRDSRNKTALDLAKAQRTKRMALILQGLVNEALDGTISDYNASRKMA